MKLSSFASILAFAPLWATAGCTVETTPSSTTAPATITVDETCKRLLAAACQRKADVACFAATEVAKCESSSFDSCKAGSAANVKESGADPAKVDACIVKIKEAATCATVDDAAKCG